MNTTAAYQAQIANKLVYLPPHSCRNGLVDSIWFSMNLHRNYRLRPFCTEDIECCVMKFSHMYIGPAIDGMCWMILVRKIGPGIILPILCQMFLSVGADAPEEMCQYLYHALASPERLALCEAIATDAQELASNPIQRWGAPNV